MKKKISQGFELIEVLSTLRRTAFFLRLGLPSTLIRQANGAFQKRYLN